MANRAGSRSVESDGRSVRTAMVRVGIVALIALAFVLAACGDTAAPAEPAAEVESAATEAPATPTATDTPAPPPAPVPTAHQPADAGRHSATDRHGSRRRGRSGNSRTDPGSRRRGANAHSRASATDAHGCSCSNLHSGAASHGGSDADTGAPPDLNATAHADDGRLRQLQLPHQHRRRRPRPRRNRRPHRNRRPRPHRSQPQRRQHRPPRPGRPPSTSPCRAPRARNTPSARLRDSSRWWWCSTGPSGERPAARSSWSCRTTTRSLNRAAWKSSPLAPTRSKTPPALLSESASSSRCSTTPRGDVPRAYGIFNLYGDGLATGSAFLVDLDGTLALALRL